MHLRSWSIAVMVTLALLVISPRCFAQTPLETVNGLNQPCSAIALPRVLTEVNERMLTTLRGNVHPLAQPQYDRGRVDDSLQLEHIILMLQRSLDQEKALATRIEQMHNPGSPNYHQWLRAEDVGECYGVADSDIGRVTGWLQNHGFRIDTIPAGKLMIIFSGTAGQVRNTFKTEMHNLDVRGEQHIANMSEPQVPAALAPVIAGFRSLNNFFPKSLAHIVGPTQRDPTTGKWHALQHPNAGEEELHSEGIDPLLTFQWFGNYWAVGPKDFYTIYNETPLLTGSKPINGAGQTLAIVQDSDVNPADVTSFRSQFGLQAYPDPPNNTQGGVNYINGVSDYCFDPGLAAYESEADIDVQWMGATAPAAIIDLVSCEDTQTTFGGDLSASYIVNNLDSAVSAFSDSFGVCEADLPGYPNPTTNYYYGTNGFYNALWEQAVAEGQTPVVAAGDGADDLCDRGDGRGPNHQDVGVTGLSVNGMASTPYNIAAGGTDFSDNYQTNFNPSSYWNSNDSSPYGSALQYIPEMAWNNTCASPILLDWIAYDQGDRYPNGPEGLCNDTANFSEKYTTIDGGSGGVSSIYSLPGWQNVYGVGLNGNYTSANKRNLPDISLFASDGVLYKGTSYFGVPVWQHMLLFCESSTLASCDYANDYDAYAMSGGGTSFVAPQLGGIIGLINQATASRQGQANYTFYALAAQEYGTPSTPNVSTTAPSLYTCEGSNINAISTYSSIFQSCIFYNINRTSQHGYDTCLGSNNTGCLVDNNDQPCATDTLGCYTNKAGDAYGLLSNSTSTFEPAFPQSAGYNAATGLGSINVTNLVTGWNSAQGSQVLTVSISGTGTGTITSVDGYINCPGTCSHPYPINTRVTLNANPAKSATFSGWSGACSGTGSCNLTMTTGLAVTASFAQRAGYYTLSVWPRGNGVVTSTDGYIDCPGGCSHSYYQSTPVTLNATPATNWTFSNWSGACSGNGSCHVTMTQNWSVGAVFARNGVLATIPVGADPYTLDANRTTNKIYVANSGDNTVTIIDGATDSTSSVQVGQNPGDVVVNEATNKIYVSLPQSNSVTVIDGVTLSTATVPTGAQPLNMAANPTNNKTYVGNYSGSSVTVIDGATLSTSTIPVGQDPLWVVANPVANKIYVTNQDSNSLTIIDGTTSSTSTVPVGEGPYPVAFNALTNKIYVANYDGDSVTVVDGNTLSTTTIPVGMGPSYIAVNSVTNRIYVSNYLDDTVTVIDGATLSILVIPVGQEPWTVKVDEATNKIYVVNYGDNTVTVIDGATNVASPPITVGISPERMVINPGTNRVYVTNSGSDTVSVIAGASPAAVQLVNVTPCRVVDTRPPHGNGPIPGGTSQSFTVPQLGGCGIPTSAAAYSLNVTVVPITTLGYLTIWPTGEDQPVVSTMNSTDGRIKANAAIVPAGYQGAVSVFVTDTTNVILDIDGYFAPPASGTYQFYPLTPCRLVDTRGADGNLGGPRLQAQTPRKFPLLQSSCIPAGLNPLAYSLNFTVVPNPSGQPLGYLTVWPAGESQPVVSTLNNPKATVVANAAIVPAGTNGGVEVYAYNTTDLLIDIDGYFAAPGSGGLSMYPSAPCRVLDTRSNGGPFNGLWNPPNGVDVLTSPCAPPSTAEALVFNATVVPNASMPYLSLWPHGEGQPNVSTLNAYDGFITSNMAIVPTNDGSIDAYAAGLTQLILDISGYFAP